MTFPKVENEAQTVAAASEQGNGETPAVKLDLSEGLHLLMLDHFLI